MDHSPPSRITRRSSRKVREKALIRGLVGETGVYRELVRKPGLSGGGGGGRLVAVQRDHGLRIAGCRGHRGGDREPLGDRALNLEAAGERDRRLVADLEPHPDDGRDSVLDY